tara:strand:- start:17681 stop:19081 length:1401 start_codon:yes stop_codon:yes gene_type:complete
MTIDYVRPEYESFLPLWEEIDSACEETNLEDLLPYLHPSDTSQENRDRNTEYRQRAVWFGASAFTEQGLVGLAFNETPSFELPPKLARLRVDSNGSGLPLQQAMQQCLAQVLRKYRAALFVTYPPGGNDTSVAEQEEGKRRATIDMIEATRIINWWTVADGGSSKLGGVVFKDVRETVEDFKVTHVDLLRALYFENGEVVDRTFVDTGGNWEPEAPIVIRDGQGNPWKEIPFAFVGAYDNSSEIRKPPMRSIVKLNIAHYRNSADYEESTFYAGSPQPWVSGWTEENVSEAEKRGFRLGSRQVIVADKFAFAQAQPNPESALAMKQKEQQMKQLGAWLLEPGTVARTATEASADKRMQYSVLSLAVLNIEDAFNDALAWAAAYENSEPGFVKVSRGFMMESVSPEIIEKFLELWDRALVGPVEAHRLLTTSNIVDPDKPVEEFEEELQTRGAAPLVQQDDEEETGE